MAVYFCNSGLVAAYEVGDWASVKFTPAIAAIHQRGQGAFHRSQVPDFSPDDGEAGFGKITHFPSRGADIARQFQQLLDVLKTEAQCLRPCDECQPLQIAFLIQAVAGRISTRLVEQPFLFVEAQCFRSHTSFSCKGGARERW